MQKAGLQREIAEELAEAINEGQSRSIEKFATKDDIKHLEEKIENKLEILKRDIVIKLGGIMVLGITVLGYMIKFGS